MRELYPDATIELLVCDYQDVAGNQCLERPIGMVRSGESSLGHMRQELGPYCEEHLRKVVDTLQHGPPVLGWCSAPTSAGTPCNAAPAHELDGRLYCGAHYRKAVAQKEGRE